MAKDKLEEVLLLANSSKDKTTEQIHGSISAAIKKGNLEFKTLHVDREGRIICH
jgi:hypothetical protein